MSDWNNEQGEEWDEPHGHRVKHVNKERFCKKNRLGHGQYGPHVYVNDRCQYCNKIDPRVKHRSNGDLNNE